MQKYLIKYSPSQKGKKIKKKKNYKGESVYEADINEGKMQSTLLALKDTI